jgi:peptidoglycan/LPS O-acetylase OafA/YrhL
MRFGILDSWRGIAALFVALYRFQAEGWLFHLPIVRHAALFVDFFFVLSGFVIAYAYLDRLDNGRAFGNFILRRFGRLWPLHVAMFLPFLAFEIIRLASGADDSAPPFTGYRAPGTIPVELAFLSSLGFYPTTGWNTPSWSISSEFWTYVVFGLLCLPARRFMGWIAAAIVAGALTAIWIYGPGHLDITFAAGTVRCMAGFFAGVLVCLAWRRLRPRLPELRGAMGAAEIPALAFAGAFIWLAGETSASLAAPFVFGAFVFIFTAEAGPVSRLMGGKAFRLIGELSYSIYMTALFLALVSGRLVMVAIAKTGIGVTREISVAGETWEVFSLPWAGVNDLLALAYLTGVVLVSWCTWRLVEKPGREWFNARADRLSGTATARAERALSN